MALDGYIYKGTRGCSPCGGEGRVITSPSTLWTATAECTFCRGRGYLGVYEPAPLRRPLAPASAPSSDDSGTPA